MAERKADILKQFVNKFTSSSVNERLFVLKLLQPILEEDEFPESAQKGVLKQLMLTLELYHNAKSRHAVEDVLRILATKHFKTFLNVFIVIVSDYSDAFKKTSPSRGSAAALTALSWTCVLLRHGFKSVDALQGKQFTKVVEIQSLLVYGTCAAKASVKCGVYNRLKRIWREMPGSLDCYAACLLDMQGGSYLLCMIGSIMKFLTKTRNSDAVQKYKGGFLDLYIKYVLGSRSKTSSHILESCKPLLYHLDHGMFKDIVLPVMDKAMLRNPEFILEVVCEMLGGLNIDLSPYAMDIGKHLAKHCHSNEEEFQQLAAQGWKYLAHLCSDSTAVEKLVKHVFAVLNGSEGKLTVTAQRLGMLTAVGNLSNNSVTGASSVQSLSSTVVECFIPVLQQEVHEGTLVHALKMLHPWCQKFSTYVPDKLIEWFKTAMDLRSSTPAVRNAYIQCMLAAFKRDTLSQGVILLPVLLKELEKGNSQSTQFQVVLASLSSSLMLAKLSQADITAESKLSKFWSITLDVKKKLFVNDKFLGAATDEALQTLLVFIEVLVLEHPQRMIDAYSKPYYRALMQIMVNRSYNVRQKAYSTVRHIYRTSGGLSIVLPLLQHYAIMLENQHTLAHNEGFEKDVDDSPNAINKQVHPRHFVDALKQLTAIPSPESDAELAKSVAMATLYTAHEPCIVNQSSDCWVDILYQLKLNPSHFLKDKFSYIITQIINMSELKQCHKNALSTIVHIIPEQVLPVVIGHVTSALSDSALITVTQEEYNIMKTPEGELYDKSILQGAAESQTKVANVRRENKLYSYAEQMAELELKKELEEKKKAKGQLKDEPKLTKKQLELKQAQLEKESKIRARLQQLDQKVMTTCALALTCFTANPSKARCHIPDLLKHVILLLGSPLAAPQMITLYIAMKLAAFQDKHVNFEPVVYSTLRVLSPKCELPPNWCEEPLKKMVTRSLLLLYTEIVPPEGLKKTSGKKALSAPSFCYVYPLLKAIIQKHTDIVEGGEGAVLKAVQILLAHTKLRSELSNKIDENGPELLPREEMFKLLMYLVGTSAGQLHEMAVQAVMNLAQSASGKEGCAWAEQMEIDVLLNSLECPAVVVRQVALQVLTELCDIILSTDDNTILEEKIAPSIWIVKFDEDAGVTKLADGLWDMCHLELTEAMYKVIVNKVVHSEDVVHNAAACALAAAVKRNRKQISMVLKELLDLYQDKLYMPPPLLDSFGRVVSEAPPDDSPARCGVAVALAQLSPYFPENKVQPMFAFFVEKGLGDRNEDVRKRMLAAAVAAITDHGKANISSLLPVFENFLAKAPDSASFDAVRQSVVILMGSLAKHLDKDDPRVKPIVAKLIETLSTPSQPVQEAVADCLPPLVPAIKQDAPNIVKKMLKLLLESENYAERRGAAYGLAGLVKGLGILAMKQLDIMTALTDAIQNKKNSRYREGALFAIEMLCMMLGRLFEPYVVHLLPHLLLCFGDPNQYVREAADETAKTVMRNLSAHGVKLILPSLLTALEEDSWRTKTGSAELLGAMAYCAPKQLSACLPSIVPKLMEVLTDSHLKVQKAGAQALKQIGSVIRNPEIQAIVPNLLEALQDPTKKTTPCLHCLLNTKFVHFIDAPSLALIMPVVQRSFQDRSTETRKMAAQIIGNMYSLTDQKDLSPYLPSIIPGLKQSLLDPVPEVRTVSARALGAMVKGMGESGFEELVPWLMETLTSDNSSVDRSGAAQGLSEVVGAFGLERLNKLMPDIIQTAERTDIPPHIRDGYIMMYIYLPGVFGDDFIPYVGPIIPSILKALADECEFVRETALKAGQRIINMYADTAIELLLPELERGLFDDNWRIRYSSVQLLGDLLYKLSGVSGKMSTETADEDDNFGTESSQQAIMRVLGTETRNRVLAGLYMGRSDTALMVRQSALHVWKIIVAHTPKTLREILPTLFELLLSCLASQCYDKRQVAARTLGDIVRKLGEKVLPEIIPILERGLESDQCDQRQGVCIGLSEIMNSTGRDHVIVFADSLIPTVCKALCDPLPEVRQAAANAFDSLHANIGSRALDDILPNLLKKLEDEKECEFALDGLKQVMAVKSRVVLPYLVPQLTTPPVNTRALSFLSSVAGDALTKHLPRILPALISAVAEKIGTPEEQQEVQHCQSVVLSVVDDAGVRTVIDELLSATNNSEASYRCAAVLTLQAYCEQTKADYSDHVSSLFRGLIHLFISYDERVLHASWDCLNAVTKKLDAPDMLQHIPTLRQAIRYAISDCKEDELPGFCLPKKGITPILPIFREGILNGPAELKESAAIGLGEVIKRTNAEALKPSVVNITGPLIRILGERFLFSVKVAILETLALLLGKCGAMLRPFLPQLRTTFVRALNDPNRMVRLKAAAALGHLVAIHPSVDPVFTELHTNVKSADDPSVRDTMLQAVRGCIKGAGAKMGVKIRKEITQTLEGLLSCNEDTTRTTAAACLGTLCAFMTDDELSLILNLHFLDADPSVEWVIRHGRSVGLFIALKEAGDKLYSTEWRSRVIMAVITYTRADRVPVCLSGLRGAAYLLQYQMDHDQIPSPELLTAISKSMKQESNDVKALAAQITSFLARSHPRVLDAPVLQAFIPMLVNGSKEKNTLVRTNSEFGLIAVLKLREGDKTYKAVLPSLEPGMRDSLAEVVNKVLKKTMLLPDAEDNIDDTYLV